MASWGQQSGRLAMHQGTPTREVRYTYTYGGGDQKKLRGASNHLTFTKPLSKGWRRNSSTLQKKILFNTLCASQSLDTTETLKRTLGPCHLRWLLALTE